ncbi:exosortase A [Candidatus Nitrotoga sp. M5]|uniref:exosortase A n=1 Tax=Candidatus Nitrotoga sp. M5 TaxID=2890409 RepID=UPI001EF30564|nr:exosortase A [Candidatus Nitrotoga sp. M5]CAH1385700.1 EpsH [Candidatus Nitrotoga sp. M5]
MTGTTPQALTTPNIDNHIGQPKSQWRFMAILTLAAIATILAIYQQTVLSTVAIWLRSETFTHGFFILPISAYLIWLKRKSLAEIAPYPDYRGLFVLAGLGLGWLLADAGSVQVVAQFCLVAMMPVTVWTMLGLRVTRAITFPLGFLFFAVPFGEFLIPPLMDFTADFVVTALQITNIPVYREGLFFTIPSGHWSVVEGCSGLRYLIASCTLGTLYGYLTYRSNKRRLIFAAMSLIVPIFANGMRAYMIVMIAHLSNMKLALGVDHYIYGWVFFGIVMTLLFWIGSFWREDQSDLQPQRNMIADNTAQRTITNQGFAMMGIVTILTAALWPAYAAYLNNRPIKTDGLVIKLPDSHQGWNLQTTPFTDWQPHYVGTHAQAMHTYRKGDKIIGVYLGYYRTQRQDAELINSQNFMIRQKHPLWSNVGEGPRKISLSGKNETILQTLLRAGNNRLLIWNWNSLDGTYTTNPYLAKLLLAKDKLFGRQDDGAAIVIAAPYEGTPETAASSMQSFVNDMLPAINSSINEVAEHGTHAH